MKDEIKKELKEIPKNILVFKDPLSCVNVCGVFLSEMNQCWCIYSMTMSKSSPYHIYKGVVDECVMD